MLQHIVIKFEPISMCILNLSSRVTLFWPNEKKKGPPSDIYDETRYLKTDRRGCQDVILYSKS